MYIEINRNSARNNFISAFIDKSFYFEKYDYIIS